MMCGLRWKSCPCPMYKAGPAEAPRQEHVRITMNSRPNPFGPIAQQHAAPKPPSPHKYLPEFAPSQAPAARPRPMGRPSSYEEEAHLNRMYEQQEHHARRMHSFDGFEHPVDRREYGHTRHSLDFEDPRRRAERRGYPPPFGEDEYRMTRAATVVAPSPPQTHAQIAAAAPARSAFEPPARPGYDRAAPRYDYASEGPYPRGRYASPDRYDDYMTDNYTSDRRRQRSADGRQPINHERQSRSRDRRAFTREQQRRASSAETWQHAPTRFPSPEPMPMPTQMQMQMQQMQAPERHMATPERHMSMSERPNPTLERHLSMQERHFQQAAARQQAPAPEPRRASSLDRRLADRFNPESRNTPGPVPGYGGAIPPPPMTSVGVPGPAPHMGLMPLVPLNRGPHPPPPLTRASTHPAQPMGMVPAPPPPIPIPTSATPRRHTMDEDIYIAGRHPGPPTPDWFGPPGHGMAPHEWDPNGGSARAPHVRRRPPPQAHREHNKFEAKPSMQAGLSGPGRGLHRVTEWVNYIEEGPPDDLAVA